jgi:hypothetical protein
MFTAEPYGSDGIMPFPFNYVVELKKFSKIYTLWYNDSLYLTRLDGNKNEAL